MIDDLFSLRALVVSSEEGLRDLFRQASASSSVPLEIVEAADVGSARAMLTAGADLAYLDGTLPFDQITQFISAARTTAQPPFTIELAAGASAQRFGADAVAGKPSRLQEAQWLLERSARVRLPSRVLIVDDSSTMRSIVRKTLTATRFPLDFSEADEGFAALKLVRDDDFHIVFLDYNMPEFNGLETLSEFKRENRRVSVVMMTSAQDNDLADRARALGAAFLKKPFFPADIEALLCRFYGLRALNPNRA